METKERVEEYNAIRQEILVYTNHIKDYRNIAYTVTAATLAFSFSDKAIEPFIALIPIMIIIPLFLACERSYLGIAKMGSYIRRFYYEDGFHWENRGPHFHMALGHYYKQRWKKNLFEEEAMFISIIIICGIIATYRTFISPASTTEKIIRYFIVAIILILTVAFIRDIRKYVSKQRGKYEHAWKRIKKAEKKMGKPLF